MKMLAFLFFLLLPVPPSLYEQYSHQNFRQAPIFSQTITPQEYDARTLHAAIFFLTNEYRAKHRRPPVAYHEALEIAAYFHSKAMAEQNFFDHDNPKNRQRRRTEDRAKLAGVANPYIAENIVYIHPERQPTTYLSVGEEILKEWIDSPGHRQNLLSKDAVQLGCGVFVRNGQWFGTQVFQWFEAVKEAKASDHF